MHLWFPYKYAVTLLHCDLIGKGWGTCGSLDVAEPQLPSSVTTRPYWLDSNNMWKTAGPPSQSQST